MYIYVVCMFVYFLCVVANGLPIFDDITRCLVMFCPLCSLAVGPGGV